MADVDLPLVELRELARSVVAAAGDPTEPFGTYLFLPSDPEAALVRAVEYEVFDEFFGNSPDLLDAEYGAYEPATVLIGVLDHRRALPVGACRVTRPSPLGLKTLADVEAVWHQDVDESVARTDLDWDPQAAWDAVTWAVAKDYRNKASDGLISISMLSVATRLMRSSGGRIWVSVLDCKVLELMDSVFPNGWIPFPGCDPIRYLDSPLSVPVYVDMDAYEPVLAARDAVMHGLLYEGVGSEPVMRQPELAPILERLGVAPAGPPGSLTR
jgi:hypothetical protein